MAPNDAPQSRALAARGLLAPAGRVLRRLLSRIPARQQQLALGALQAASARWPQLARLVQRFVPDAPGNSAGAPAVADAFPSSGARMSQNDDEVAALVAALRDPSAEVAAQAAEALARHAPSLKEPEAATSALTHVVENRDGYFNSMTRASAVRTLGVLLPGHKGSILVTAVSDVDALVSLAAIAALSDRDDGASVSALMAVLENLAGFYLPVSRQAAARAITRLRNYEPDRLRRVLENEYDPAVRDTLSALAN